MILLSRPFISLALCCALIPSISAVCCGADGFLIRLTVENRVEVVPYQLPRSDREEQTGIVVWSRGGPEQWAIVPGKLQPIAGSSALASANLSGSRGSGASGAAGPEAMTFQPEQLLGQVVTRAVSITFITPTDGGLHLDGRITFRRQADSGTEKFPAADVKLRSGTKDLLTLSFTAGQSEMRWDEIPKLPAELKNGLPAGGYALRIGSGPLTPFRVIDQQTSGKLLSPLAQLQKVAGIDSPAYGLAVVQQLTCQPDADGEAQSYTADALDQLDAAGRQSPALLKSPWFIALRGRLLMQLTESDAKRPTDVAATGIELIDAARAAIQEGNWDTAQQTLALPAANESPRAQALAILYRAVIAAESDSGGLESPDVLYREALARLQGGDAADLFRAHNNYGGMLFARARDQVHNHAFQAAAGVQTPILRALDDWCGALANYEQALVYAAKLDPALDAGVRINQSGLYGLLADIIRVLDAGSEGTRQFTAGEAAATKTAVDLVQQVLAKSKQLDAVSRAAAHESVAQFAFRAGNADQARTEAEQALFAFVEAESLTGVESVERLLGLIEKKDSAAAFRHLQTSHLLTELLRARIPPDRAGRSRAGFFARRAYVTERMIELLIAQNKPAEALRTAEAAKARSLQDVLAQRGVTTPSDYNARDIDVLLAGWPKDVAAVEYFLGTERVWGFVVNQQGKVTAWQLQSADGQPLASRDLVRRVQSLLTSFESQANKMFRQASAGNGFDHSWQDELHRFYGELLPVQVRAELKTAKHVVLVPHHVLNYFPFAALVTEPDRATRGKLELPQPKFLIEEPFSLSRAPSLAVWDVLRRREANFAQIQAVGIVDFQNADPLPGVEADLANLKAAFGSRLQKLVAKEEATEANIREILREPGMLFIGTHGTNVAEQPLASHLLTHAGANDDGYFTAGELFAGEVKSSLIVMSACYSGLADQSPLPGDDLFGLERAFLSAGASTVVSGLWDVYDGTGPLLMKSFFSELVAGKSTAASLANAQRSFLADRRKEGPGDPWIHPYFWAVYTISGSELTALERSARN